MLRVAALLARQGRQVENVFSAARTAVRQVSVSATLREQVEQEFKPPVPTYGTAGRYASALYSAAARAGKLDEVMEGLGVVYNVTEEDETFGQYLVDPSIPKTKKVEELGSLLDEMKVADLVKNFIVVLAENGRLKEFSKIATTFEELVAASRGEVKAIVTTAEGLDEEELDDIIASLKQLCRPDETLVVEQKIEPRIIGGVIVDIGDKHIDRSILSRVKEIQKLVLEATI